MKEDCQGFGDDTLFLLFVGKWSQMLHAMHRLLRLNRLLYGCSG